ncbi:hypothetical protein NDI45_12945 [Leptolyngbya sp. GB1-A1]|uniref:hypothetical protein n=1 Tax=Leptolyngbya sp. GB1-A1 TaxID=2933908 RepID=UPI003298AFFB
MSRSALPLQVVRSPRWGKCFALLISTALMAATLSLTACDSRKATVSTTTRTTEPTPVQPSPSPLSSPTPIASSEIPKPVPATPSKPLTPPAATPKPAARPSTPQPDEDSSVQPDGLAVYPDSPLPTPDGIRLGQIEYRSSATAADAALEAAIVNIMVDRSGDKSLLESMRYTYNRVDLNDDGAPEALVYLMGSYTCGSGGCTMLILEPAGQSYEMVSRMTLVNPPVVIAQDTTAGWKDLMIFVEGGGATPHYARLQFDGSSYPSNPSIAPPVTSEAPLNGTAILTEKMTPDDGIKIKL